MSWKKHDYFGYTFEVSIRHPNWRKSIITLSYMFIIFFWSVTSCWKYNYQIWPSHRDALLSHSITPLLPLIIVPFQISSLLKLNFHTHFQERVLRSMGERKSVVHQALISLLDIIVFEAICLLLIESVITYLYRDYSISFNSFTTRFPSFSTANHYSI